MDVILKYFSEFSPLQLQQFEALEGLYKEWNEKINVVSRKDIDQIYLHHVLHSLSIAAIANFKPGAEVIDIGCGGGILSESMAMQGVMINIILAVFNLLPLPPLDGSHILECFLSPKASYHYSRMAPYGFWILLALLFTGILAEIMTPLMGIMFSLIHVVFGI